MTNDDRAIVQLMGDKELIEALQSLTYATQHKYNKLILRDAGRKEIVPYLKAAVPHVTGNLARSMGVVTGRSRNKSTVFVGPRMSHNKTLSGNQGYKGWVANILENAKDERRKPEKAKAFKPFFGTASGPGFVRSVGPIKRKTNLVFVIKSRMNGAERHITSATRRVLERTWKRKVGGKYSKNWTLKDYAVAKGRE